MSLDRSLKTSGGLARHRNVLTRAEKVARLQNEDRWENVDGIFDLPKVANRNIKVGKKSKKKDEGEEE
jgi:small basic protein (TIGR04137 family)